MLIHSLRSSHVEYEPGQDRKQRNLTSRSAAQSVMMVAHSRVETENLAVYRRMWDALWRQN